MAADHSKQTFTTGHDTLVVCRFAPGAKTWLKTILQYLHPNNKFSSERLTSAMNDHTRAVNEHNFENQPLEVFRTHLATHSSASSRHLKAIDNFRVQKAKELNQKSYILDFFETMSGPAEPAAFLLAVDTGSFSTICDYFSADNRNVAVVDYQKGKLYYQGERWEISGGEKEITEDDVVETIFWHLPVGIMQGVKEAIFPVFEKDK